MALNAIREQAFGRMQPVTKPLDGRTIIVTGANTGLGLQTAIHLARVAPGGRIILACRDVTKGEAARKTLLDAKGIKEGTAEKGLVVEVWKLDLASFASVQTFVSRAEKELDRLDSLVENAGLMTDKWSQTEDEWETTLQVNVLATGLLGLLLLPFLKRTAALPAPSSTSAEGASTPFKPHLTIVGSEMHSFTQFKEAKMDGPILLNMNQEANFKANAPERYPTSKLMNVYLALGLAALAGDDIIVNVVNPGLCVSDFKRDMNWIGRWIMDAMSRTTESGALNIGWAATEDTSSVPGAYVSVTSIKPTSAWTHTEEGKAVEQRCWDEMMAVWGDIAKEKVHAVLEACHP